ncbi:M13 family metallopeptidase [Aliiglaciecola sp. 2_MG-2023]|uniref:M13 family metallopeptidase n=1 Tax=unclassified Aliiglaciecola TaxID=2593648 RepID=UPI0026E4622B|nr:MULTISPECIES: M13 family metallopeptidase [unclassified Aliiglaciecola]MDO6710833.1 M13 family metallopeptidase [Aliiglaciecola sp. 2_MG-2023]MDO6752314.1 M13 family metallopeptidase [Aliiglaciecola sp. 1_MG-2023]
MKKTLIAASIASVFILSACNKSADTPAPKQDVAATTQTTKAELGNFGIELDARDESVKPGDDFFRYAGGTWYDNFVIPSDKVRYGAFTKLAERSEKQIKTIIDELANTSNSEELTSEEQLIANFYKAYMDTEAANAKGIAAISPVLESISSISDKTQLTAMFGRAWLDGSASPIYGGMWFNRLNPDQYQMSVGVGGLGLPDRSYYLEDSERFIEIREAYVAHIEEMLNFAKVEDAAQKAKGILALETKIAEAQWPREKRRDRDLTLNQIERQQLSTDYPGFDWDTYFAETEYKVPHLNMSQPEPIKKAIELVNSEPLSVWKDYMTYHTITNQAELLSDEIFSANFEFYGKTLNGQQEPRPRWKRAIAQMSGTQSLGFAIGKTYVEKHFPASSKAQMAELVENLRTALGERIDSLQWMGDETKKNAHAKLASFRPKIGYPDEWQSFNGLEIKPDDLIGNVQRIRKFFRDDSAAQELEKTDRERWGMSPQQVNAYYNSSFNEIVFPAAILQPPFFDPNADPAVNYGGIGAVIGHEMGHGFDDQGSKSDENGIQRNWWTDEDRAAFEARTDALAAQYDGYEPIEGSHVNGRLTLGENIGDVGGLAMAYHAYKLSLNGKEAPVIDGVTGDQRFFLAWAQVWREKRTEQSLMSQLKSDPHAPARYRTVAPRNHDAWYKAFNVQPGDALYLAPEERVRIW